MCELIINGGNRLCGEVKIQGSKNASLPILAATLLTDERCVIHNCPNISDTKTAFEILNDLGADVISLRDYVIVRAKKLCNDKIPQDLMGRMRSSVMFLGAILARCGTAVICNPGGCNLGERPIDIHLRSLRRLGVRVCETNGCIFCSLGEKTAGEVTLLYPSVGATENIMLLCAGLDTSVRINNAAREPEIVDLQNFLNLMGADIRGAGTETITIYPSQGLHGCEYRVMPDRIVAATYACATAACGGEVSLVGAESGHMRIVNAALCAAGCEIKNNGSGILVCADSRPKAIEMIKTLPYPGFPTDVQPLLGAVLMTADGDSELCEAIFKKRFEYYSQLELMGADAEIKGNTLVIHGRERLFGTEVSAADLRGGAALIIAALAASGTTVVNNVHYIDRGYESIERDLKLIGADIMRI
ncbi:MAG: UDP-N-acetylglucosamine 1-carboxyvinyltransferase [Eubacteriales bacterium]|nr:UDP-N-acetylglucosamine 1-carboxyvinyltransferase [Eubacteriales bacterium]MDY4214149.1 UDP-N-acetylglucosamine 1-carboxyvinyltransferase [Eubacteriales bacterium]MDY5230215.1 UDP-N-acetylglucosamine 1-carboxyvinyltransferase [Eubacteriales bacterium]